MVIRPWRRLAPLDPEERDPADPELEADLRLWPTAGGTGSRSHMEDRTVEIWSRERQRRFAIETGEIEGIYRLRREAKDRLVREGLDTARAQDQLEPRHPGSRLRELLLDELAALERMMDHARGGAPLDTDEIRGWQAKATRHQGDRLVELGGGAEGETTTRIRVPMVPGEYKTNENVIVSGEVEYEFCPPGEVEKELQVMLRVAAEQQTGSRSTAACGAWIHAAFNAIHPFPDGNGRTGRLLLAWVYLRRGEPPPIIHEEERREYFAAMREAHGGRVEALRDLIHENAATMLKLHLREATANDDAGANPIVRRIAALKERDPAGSVLVKVAEREVGLYWRTGSDANVATPIVASIPDELAIQALVESGEKTGGEATALWMEVRRRRGEMNRPPHE